MAQAGLRLLEKTLGFRYIARTRRDDVIALFGSHARDEAAADSDVDVFIDLAPDVAFGLVPSMDAFDTIQKAVGPDVDVGYSTRDGLSPYVRAGIEREAIRAF